MWIVFNWIVLIVVTLGVLGSLFSGELDIFVIIVGLAIGLFCIRNIQKASK